MHKRYLAVMMISALAVLPTLAQANARLMSVTPFDGGCVSGPAGPAVQAWDVESGKTYTLTISLATDCGNGGTDPTMNVRVNSTTHGNTDLVATYVGPNPGDYAFNYTMPSNAFCTFPIYYCTTPGQNNTGMLVVRNDGAGPAGGFQAHLRASDWSAGCTNPTPRLNGDCGTVPVEPSTWGKVKSLYR